MSSIGDRLKEIREEHGLSQTALAELAGTTRKSQFNYETDARRPDADYLAALAAQGMDILYILTGQLSPPIAPTSALPPRVRALVDNYEHTDEEGKKIIESTASFAAQQKKRKAA